MRTTIRLNDDLLAEVKALAASRKCTLTAVIEEALRESLHRRKRAPRGARVRLVTVSGRGPKPGVDLDDTRSLIDVMESGLEDS